MLYHQSQISDRHMYEIRAAHCGFFFAQRNQFVKALAGQSMLSPAAVPNYYVYPYYLKSNVDTKHNLVLTVLLHGRRDPNSRLYLIALELIKDIWKYLKPHYAFVLPRSNKRHREDWYHRFSTLPPPTGININMMPFLLDDESTLPPHCRNYLKYLRDSPWYGLKPPPGGVAYLTIRESYLPGGCTHLRPGLTVDSEVHQIQSLQSTRSCLSSRDPSKWITQKVLTGGTILCSNTTNSHRMWNFGLQDQSQIDNPRPHGNIEHIRPWILGTTSNANVRNEIYWISRNTPYEVLPVSKPGFRQFIKLVIGGIQRWNSFNSTENPYGIKPPDSTAIIYDDSVESEIIGLDEDFSSVLKVVILGPHGSGKTYLARKILENRENCKLFSIGKDVDNLSETEVRRNDSWILEGINGEVIQKFFQEADLVILTNPGLDVCLMRKEGEDAAREVNESFLMENKANSLDFHQNLFLRSERRKIYLSSQREAEKFIQNFTRK